MAPTITSSISEFVNALTNIIAGVFSSFMAIFQAILAFFLNLFQSAFQLVTSFIKLGADMLQGAFGFIGANFFALAVIGGAAYWYMNSNQRQRGKGITQKN